MPQPSDQKPALPPNHQYDCMNQDCVWEGTFDSWRAMNWSRTSAVSNLMYDKSSPKTYAPEFGDRDFKFSEYSGWFDCTRQRQWRWCIVIHFFRSARSTVHGRNERAPEQMWPSFEGEKKNKSDTRCNMTGKLRLGHYVSSGLRSQRWNLDTRRSGRTRRRNARNKVLSLIFVNNKILS